MYANPEIFTDRTSWPSPALEQNPNHKSTLYAQERVFILSLGFYENDDLWAKLLSSMLKSGGYFLLQERDSLPFPVFFVFPHQHGGEVEEGLTTMGMGPFKIQTHVIRNTIFSFDLGENECEKRDMGW